MDKRNIFLWTLYDFANSIAVVVFFIYFSQWLVIDNKVNDAWYNLLFIGSTTLLILTAPVGGTIADKLGVKMPFLRVLTVLSAILLLACSLLAVLLPSSTSVVIAVCILYMFSNYLYQFSFTFYNAIFHDIAPLKVQGFVSGIGQTANWLGQIAGILITLPLATGAIYLFGNSGRVQTFIPATLLFFLLSLPMLLFFREKVKPKTVSISIGKEYKDFIQDFKGLLGVPGMKYFLLGYFFINNAMLTAVNNMAIYLEQVFKVSDAIKSVLLIEILFTAALGAFIGGYISDRVGLKRTLLVIIVCWMILFPVIAFITDFTFLTMLLVFLGFLYGATWTVTRAIMSYLAPADRLSHSFSYYTMSERFSAFLGPIVWGSATLFLVSMGDFRYRIALILMSGFILIGFLIIRNIPERKGVAKST